MKIIIIEDELLMAEALRGEILSIDATIEISATLGSIQEALTYLNEYDYPDLFFSDIELSDGLSFEIFKRISNKTPIIFCTAYNNYALDAFEVYGIDYILKPFDNESISAAIKKFKQITKQAVQIDYAPIIEMLSKPQKKNTILIHKGDKITPLPIEEIALAQLENGIVYVYTFNNTRHSINYNMERLQSLLGNYFYRVNRQYIIHKGNIDHAAQYFGRKLIVHPKISFKDQLIISKANASDFLSWLEDA